MARLYEALLDKLKLVEFRPYKVEADLWIQDAWFNYEYITIYSDEVIFFGNDTTGILKLLNTLFPLKGVGDPEFCLGGDVGTT